MKMTDERISAISACGISAPVTLRASMYSSPSSASTRHPRWERIATAASTSRRRGTFRMTERAGKTMLAASQGSEAFFEP